MFKTLRFLPAVALATGMICTSLSAQTQETPKTEGETATTEAPATGPKEIPTADTVLARVGDSEITVGNLIALRAGLPPQYAQIPIEMIAPGMLDQLVRQSILAQSSKGEPSKLETLTLENEKTALRAEAEARKIVATAVTDEAVQKAYDEQIAKAPAETEYHAAHILVASEDDAKAAIKELDGGADFNELAKAKSTGPSGPEGGDLGWFSDGMMVEPFFEAVQKMKPGEISPPVQTEFGWHVIKLIETREKPKPTLDEVREELTTELQQEALNAYIETLEKDIKVERTDLNTLDLNVINDPALLEK